MFESRSPGLRFVSFANNRTTSPSPSSRTSSSRPSSAAPPSAAPSSSATARPASPWTRPPRPPPTRPRPPTPPAPLPRPPPPCPRTWATPAASPLPARSGPVTSRPARAGPCSRRAGTRSKGGGRARPSSRPTRSRTRRGGRCSGRIAGEREREVSRLLWGWELGERERCFLGGKGGAVGSRGAGRCGVRGQILFSSFTFLPASTFFFFFRFVHSPAALSLLNVFSHFIHFFLLRPPPFPAPVSPQFFSSLFCVCGMFETGIPWAHVHVHT